MRVFLPYAKLVSEHLGMLLLVARILTVIGWLTVLFAVWFVAVSLSSPTWQFGALSATIVFVYAFGFLVVGGVLAALVAIEENLRRRTRGF